MGEEEDVLLTVQVRGPIDGEDMLVQFRGLDSAMAVKKTLGGALSIWKKRVYRGAEVVVWREEGGGGGEGEEGREREGCDTMEGYNTSTREGCNTMEGYNMFVEEFGGGEEEKVKEREKERGKGEGKEEEGIPKTR